MALAGSKRRRVCALAAASPRLATPSLPRMLDTWTLAVLGEMNSSAAISRLLRPAATRRSTSSSRSVRPSSPPPAPGSPGAWPSDASSPVQPDPGAPGEDRDLLGERVRAQFVGQRDRAPQPFRRAVAVAAGQRGLGRVQQRLAQRIGLAEDRPRGGGLVPGGEQPGGLPVGPLRPAWRRRRRGERRRVGGRRPRRPRQRSAGKRAGPGRTSLVSPRSSATVRLWRPPRRGAARRA